MKSKKKNAKKENQPSASVSGDDHHSIGDSPPVSGTSEMAPDLDRKAASSTAEGSTHHRDSVELRKVKSDVDTMREGYLTFLRSALPVIDDELFPRYLDAVSSITNKFVAMSLVKASGCSRSDQDQPDNHQEMMVSEAVGREPPPSHGSPPLAMKEHEEELVPMDLTRKHVSHGDPEPPFVPSTSRDQGAHGTAVEPLPGPSHACG